MKYILSINGRTVTEEEYNKKYRELGGHWIQRGCDYDGVITTIKVNDVGFEFIFRETPIK